MNHVTIEGHQFFLLSPSNQWYITGQASQPKLNAERIHQHWTLWILAGVLFLVAGSSFDSGREAWWLRYKLQSDGVRGMAVITDLRKEAGESGPTLYAR